MLLKRKKQKEKEDEAAHAAYEKIFEEQEALQHKHELYNRYKPMADTYFNNYPFRHSVNIDCVTYFNPDSKSFKQFKHSSNSQSYDIDEAIAMAENGLPRDVHRNRRHRPSSPPSPCPEPAAPGRAESALDLPTWLRP